MIRALIVAWILVSAGGAQAQSFACRYASTDDELAICASEALSRLDQRMSDLYSDLRRTLVGEARAELDLSQQAWLQRRARCHDNAACIASVYRARIERLENWN
ncbi:MAG: lysozyme inhibitor LprI family protein [Hyphomicrobiales bacterium]